MKTGEEKARYIVREIRNIRSYRRIIDDLNQELKDNERKRRELQVPHSSLGAEKVAPTVSPKGIGGILMDSYGEDTELENERAKFEIRKKEAEDMKSHFMIRCPVRDKPFASDYLNCVPYEVMRRKHHVSHPYRHMIELIKSVY